MYINLYTNLEKGKCGNAEPLGRDRDRLPSGCVFYTKLMLKILL